MNREDLLKSIAETGYSVGFGAKKHFATYDIVAKVPGIIGFASTAVGIFALFLDFLSTKFLSAAFIVFGVAGMSMSHYDHKKEEYATAGGDLTQLFNRLRTLYFNVKAADGSDLSEFEETLAEIQEQFGAQCISKQILFSDWYAHYKFFWQHQIEWIDEQKKFRFFRDKIPLSFTVAVIALAVVAVLILVMCR